MGSESIVGRIARVDFWAVLPAGFYCLVVVAPSVAASCTEQAPPENLLAVLEPLGEMTTKYPASVVLLLFLAYLLGSMIRALRVNWAQRITFPFTLPFPYTDRLRRDLGVLRQNADATKLDPSKLPAIGNHISQSVYQYWKDALCLRSQPAFAYYQGFEARSRFAAGMVWAGLSGIVGSAVMLVADSGLHAATFQLFALSALVYGAYSFNLRRVRRQEAGSLLFLYVIHLQHQGQEPECAD